MLLGLVAWSDAHPPGMWTVVDSILGAQQHYFVEIDHKIISTTILSLSLIQAGNFSITG